MSFQFMELQGVNSMKFLIIAFVINVGDIPTLTLTVIVVCIFILIILVLFNESACDRLIRILRVMLGKSENTQRQKRK